MKRICLLLLSAALLSTAACSHNIAAPPTPAVSASTWDQEVYRELRTARAGLAEASVQVQAYPEMKPVLNQAIRAYNAAAAAFSAYEAAQTPANQQQLTAAVAAATAALTDFVTKVGAKKGGAQ